MWSDGRDDTGNNEIKESNRIELNRIKSNSCGNRRVYLDRTILKARELNHRILTKHSHPIQPFIQTNTHSINHPLPQ